MAEDIPLQENVEEEKVIEEEVIVEMEKPTVKIKEATVRVEVNTIVDSLVSKVIED